MSKYEYWKVELLHQDKNRVVIGLVYFEPKTKQPCQPMIVEFKADMISGRHKKRVSHAKKLERV